VHFLKLRAFSPILPNSESITEPRSLRQSNLETTDQQKESPAEILASLLYPTLGATDIETEKETPEHITERLPKETETINQSTPAETPAAETRPILKPATETSAREKAAIQSTIIETPPSPSSTATQPQPQSPPPPTSPIFPPTVQKFATGMVSVAREEFSRILDLGVPMDKTRPGMEEVLILYNDERSLPKTNSQKKPSSFSMATTANTSTGSIVHIPADAALEKCEHVNVILNNHEQARAQCLAIVPQYESHTIQHFMRVPPGEDGVPKTARVDKKHELRLVSRSHQSDGEIIFNPPKEMHILKSWKVLQRYMESFDSVLSELKPLAQKTAKNNTIVVM
jgi:hypothetical protein